MPGQNSLPDVEPGSLLMAYWSREELLLVWAKIKSSILISLKKNLTAAPQVRTWSTRCARWFDESQGVQTSYIVLVTKAKRVSHNRVSIGIINVGRGTDGERQRLEDVSSVPFCCLVKKKTVCRRHNQCSTQPLLYRHGRAGLGTGSLLHSIVRKLRVRESA